MKYLKTIIILLLLLGCSVKNNRMREFDKILGKENNETLNLLVLEFENNFLKKTYPNLELPKAYRRFLVETSEGKIDYTKAVTEKSKNIFNKSQLRLEIFCVADSTWIEPNPWTDKNLLVKARTRCINPDGTFINGAMEMPFYEKKISRDSILKKYMNVVKTNHNGKYLKALNSISDKSAFLRSFVEVKNAACIIPFYMTAESILDFNVDLNDYYIRRIIVAELTI